MKSISTSSQFSFEELATEVNSVVEDLRWLHLEVSIRNRFNDILFQEVATPEEFLRRALMDMRAKLGLLEISIFIRIRNAIRPTYRDCDAYAYWKDDAVPWLQDIEHVFRGVRKDESPRPEVLHYSVDGEPMTILIMPILVDGEPVAVILFATRSNALIPRFRHFIISIATPLSVSIDYILNVQKLRSRSDELETRVGERTAELEWTHNFLVKLVDSVSLLIMACDQRGRILMWNKAAESFTGVHRSELRTFDDFLAALGISAGQNGILYQSLKNQFVDSGVISPFEMSIRTRQGDQRIISWTHAAVKTESGQVLLQFGLDTTDTCLLIERIKQYEERLDEMLSVRFREEFREQEHATMSLYSSGAVIIRTDPDGTIRNISSSNIRLPHRSIKHLIGCSLLDANIPEQDREQVEYLLNRMGNIQPGEFCQSTFQLRGDSDALTRFQWQSWLLAGKIGGEGVCWHLGIPIVETDRESATVDRFVPLLSAPEAKLSQRYRFLMKYVPFPLLHIDESNRIINANPAFQDAAGTDIPFGTPIDDFATFEVHGKSDPAPCNLYILTKDGITLTHRGIVTSINIFGKTVREIILDIQE